MLRNEAASCLRAVVGHRDDLYAGNAPPRWHMEVTSDRTRSHDPDSNVMVCHDPSLRTTPRLPDRHAPARTRICEAHGAIRSPGCALRRACPGEGGGAPAVGPRRLPGGIPPVQQRDAPRYVRPECDDARAARWRHVAFRAA